MKAMPTNSFEMAPLSDFVVREIKPIVELPEVELHSWLDWHPGVLINISHADWTVYVDALKPTDVEVVIHAIEKWTIVWNKAV